MVQEVIESIPHDGQIWLFLVQASGGTSMCYPVCGMVSLYNRK